jgi:hypothetical protein
MMHICMTYLYTKFHVHISNGSLDFATKSIAKENCRAAIVLLLQSTETKLVLVLLPPTSSCARHAVITDCRKFRSTRSRWPPMS